MYHYAGNNPIKYTDPDGKQTVTFNQEEYIKQQLNAHTAAFDAVVRDFFGKIGNSIFNIFTGNASYQVYAKASLNILNVDCNIFDLKIGSKGQDLSFSLEQKAADKFLEQFEKLIDSPITLTSSKLKVSAGGVSFTLQTDGTNLKVNANIGKNKSIDFGALGKGEVSICAGINITTNMNEGPCGTIKNGQSEEIERDKILYNYFTSTDRLYELIEEY